MKLHLLTNSKWLYRTSAMSQPTSVAGKSKPNSNENKKMTTFERCASFSKLSKQKQTTLRSDLSAVNSTSENSSQGKSINLKVVLKCTDDSSYVLVPKEHIEQRVDSSVILIDGKVRRQAVLLGEGDAGSMNFLYEQLKKADLLINQAKLKLKNLNGKPVNEPSKRMSEIDCDTPKTAKYSTVTVRRKLFTDNIDNTKGHQQQNSNTDVTAKEPTSKQLVPRRLPGRKRKQTVFNFRNKNGGSDDSECSNKTFFDDDSDADRHWYPENEDEESSNDSDCEPKRKKQKHESIQDSNSLHPLNNQSACTEETPYLEQEVIPSAHNLRQSPQDSTCIPTHNSQLIPTEKISSSEQNLELSVSQHKRDWSKKACCVYCGKCFAKLPRHWERCHKNEIDVAKILAQPQRSTNRFVLIQDLKNKGNFLHNSEVIKTGKGILIPKKIPSKGENSETNAFVPCPYCRAFYKKGTLASHVKICKNNKDQLRPDMPMRNIQSKAALLLPSPLRISHRFKLEVFGKMKVDSVYREIRGDQLILDFGGQLYDKHGDENHLHGFIAQKMREVGRFLLVLKKTDQSVCSLEDCFQPRRVPDVIAGLNKVAGFDSNNRSYKTPSLILKLAASIKKCGQIAIGNALRVSNESQKTTLENFIRLFSQEVQLLTFRSLKTLKRRKWNKPPLIPLANDVRKLNDYLKKEGDKLMKDINDMPTKESLFKLSQNTLATITCFNRKRVGEVERIPLHESKNIKIGQLTSDVISTLSKAEQQLVRCLGRVEVRGKTGRKVAVIITADMKTKMDLLCRPMNRRLMGVADSNIYLFASKTDPENPLRGCDVLRKYAYKCGAERPENITSTKLRKHLATMSQVMNLNKNELDILANFMGHDIRVHRQFYRLPEDVLQIAKVSKVLLNLEKGRSDLLVGNNLDTVDVGETEAVMDEESEDEDEDMVQEEPLEENELFHGSPSTSSRSDQDVSPPVNPPTTSTITYNDIQPSSTAKQNKKRIPWTEQENDAVLQYFERFIMLRSLPGKTECEKSKIAYPVLKNRTWSQIKFKIKNSLTKLNGQ